MKLLLSNSELSPAPGIILKSYEVATNPAILTEEDEASLIQSINTAFLYNPQNTSETTQTMKTLSNSGKSWGGLGFLMACSMLKKAGGELGFDYNRKFNKFEFKAIIPKDNLRKIPRVMAGYSI